MNISDVNSIAGVVFGGIGAATGIGSLILSIKTRHDVNKPKIKFNLCKVKNGEYRTHYNMYIENISNYNLYDFTVKLENSEDIIKPSLIEAINILKEDIPVFTIGQAYESYLFNATDYKNKINYITFNVSYKLKKDGKCVNESYTININALRNVSMKLEESEG